MGIPVKAKDRWLHWSLQSTTCSQMISPTTWARLWWNLQSCGKTHYGMSSSLFCSLQWLAYTSDWYTKRIPTWNVNWGCLHYTTAWLYSSPTPISCFQAAQSFVWLKTSPTGLVFTVELQVDSTWFHQLPLRHFLIYFSLRWLSHVGFNLCGWHHNHMLQSCCYSVTAPRTTQWLRNQRLRATELFPWYRSYAMQPGNYTVTTAIYSGHSQTHKNGRCKADQLSNGFLYSSF